MSRWKNLSVPRVSIRIGITWRAVRKTVMSSSSIHNLDKQAVTKLCSGQIILSITAVVKELIENAIDAGATAIDVR